MTTTTGRDHHPHLPRAWRDQVVLGLRARGASGAAIGDALAVANAHCADSGRPPHEALGPPDEFAADLARDAARRTRPATATALGSLAGLAALHLAVGATEAAVAGGRARVSLGDVLAVLLVVGVVLSLDRWMADVLRRPVVAGSVLAATLLASVGLLVGVSAPALLLPPVVPGAAAVLLLVAEAWWSGRHVDADPVVDPLLGDPDPRGTRLVVALRPWLFTVATLVAVALVAVLAA